MGRKLKALPEVGRRFGRPDIERCDLFVDQGFTDWGKYLGGLPQFRDGAEKGAQISSGVPSGGFKKCGIQRMAGFFDPEFRTIAVDDPYVESWKFQGRPTPHPRDGPWVPAHPAYKHATPGDTYGTFTKSTDYPAFSPLTRASAKKQKELINFLTNPAKKGNSGYLDICINKYPPHAVGDKVDTFVSAKEIQAKNWNKHKAKIRNGPLKAGFYPRYFDENPYKNSITGPTYVEPKEKVYGKSRGVFYPPAAPKLPGNNHDGCFTKFPEWREDPYVSALEAQKRLEKKPKSDSVFRPEPRLKTYYTPSVVNNKVDIACNERTWRTMKPITYPQFNL